MSLALIVWTFAARRDGATFILLIERPLTFGRSLSGTFFPYITYFSKMFPCFLPDLHSYGHHLFPRIAGVYYWEELRTQYRVNKKMDLIEFCAFRVAGVGRDEYRGMSMCALDLSKLGNLLPRCDIPVD